MCLLMSFVFLALTMSKSSFEIKTSPESSLFERINCLSPSGRWLRSTVPKKRVFGQKQIGNIVAVRIVGLSERELFFWEKEEGVSLNNYASRRS